MQSPLHWPRKIEDAHLSCPKYATLREENFNKSCTETVKRELYTSTFLSGRTGNESDEIKSNSHK